MEEVSVDSTYSFTILDSHGYEGREVHSLPSISQKIRKVSGVIEYDFEGLRMGAEGVSSDMSPKAQEPATLVSRHTLHLSLFRLVQPFFTLLLKHVLR